MDKQYLAMLGPGFWVVRCLFLPAGGRAGASNSLRQVDAPTGRLQ